MKKTILKFFKIIGYKLFKVQVTNILSEEKVIHTVVERSALKAVINASQNYTNAEIEKYSFKVIN